MDPSRRRAVQRPAWTPVLAGDDAAEATAVAGELARRIRDAGLVTQAVAECRRQTLHPRSIHWRPESTSQGWAGLALLCAVADACLPGEGWDAAGFDHLQRAARGAEQRGSLAYGMYSGLGGLAFTAWLLSRDGRRYRTLRSSLDEALIPLVTTATESWARRRPHGVAVSTFDVISGLAGVGRYLLLFPRDAAHRSVLEAILRCLVAFSEEEEGVPHWHTPSDLLPEGYSRTLYVAGCVNCGLAHGVPGPLALLSLALAEGVLVDGQRQAIARIADWLISHSIVDEWGINWPSAVPLDPGCRARLDSPSRRPPVGAWAPSRAAWCYGSPGIARALWLAGVALEDERYREMAIEVMAAVYRRPSSARQIDSPTLCHGIAGLQQITLRFASESGLPLFVDAAHTLHRQLLDAYEPASLMGYRHIESGDHRLDHPGLLDGAAGVALVLLAAGTAVVPTWDAMFLLS